jgi:hypothetical protein
MSFSAQHSRRGGPRGPCALLGALLLGCAAPEEAPPLPEPPDGAELVLELGELEVYKAFEGELCAGTLRRIELHVEGLVELFDMDPPRARVFLHAEREAVDEVCSFPISTRGCTTWWGAHAMPSVVNHELAHVFVRNATGQVRTRPAIEEGVAWRLDGSGTRVGNYGSLWLEEIVPLHEFEEMLAMRSPFDLPYKGPRHFFAWAIDRFGIDAVMHTHVETWKALGNGAGDAELAAALAEGLGFGSLAALYAEYEATHAVVYPPLPDTVKVFAADEVLGGLTLDTSCTGAYTEGPTDGKLLTIVRIEIPEAGEYAVEHGSLPLGGPVNPLRLQPTEPSHEDIGDEWSAVACVYPHAPPHFAFPRAGQYELTAGCRPIQQRCTGEHEIDQASEEPLSARATGKDICDPY